MISRGAGDRAACRIPTVVHRLRRGTFQSASQIAIEFVECTTLGYWMHRAPQLARELEVFNTAAGRGLAAAPERDSRAPRFKPTRMIGADGQGPLMTSAWCRSPSSGTSPANESESASAIEGPADGRRERARRGGDISDVTGSSRTMNGGSGATAATG